MVRPERCLRCGACAACCPSGAVVPAGDGRCRVCGSCVLACPTEARVIAGAVMSSGAVLTEILKDRIFHEESGGGVTFSGGEPLAQVEFLKEILDACRRHGVHSAVDTCGHAPREDLLAVASRTDLFLYDLKGMDEERHRRQTGVACGPILDNLRALCEVHRRVWLRIPVVPGLCAGAREMEAMADFAGTLSGVDRVHLLPGHRLGIDKHRALGRSCPEGAVSAPGPKEVEVIADIWRERGFDVHVGG